jgi:hypothetical protein
MAEELLQANGNAMLAHPGRIAFHPAPWVDRPLATP